MRIIAGLLAGRTFHAPRGHATHPMSEKIRGAIFNMLGDISGLSVLDAFAGSGALAFEALSRSAASATLLDRDKTAVRTIKENTAILGLADKVKITEASAGSWSERNQTKRYDLIFCDPPYNDVQPATIVKLCNHLQPGGLIVLSLPPAERFSLKESLKLIAHKQYGDAELRFYRRDALPGLQ